MFSWIHIEDFFNLIIFFQNRKELSGVYNCSSPNPVDNRTLMKSLRQAMHVGIGLPTPKFLLKIGAFFIKTETELVLKSRWVVPEKLLAAGYVFNYPILDMALKNILNK
jgi:NAD dependent epimerase/dehydratase family enzyme